jgi:hypothetical protein
MSDLGYNYSSSNQIVDRGATGIAHGLSNSIGGAITMPHSILNPSEQSNIPYGYCHCGCGQLAPLAACTSSKKGLQKGQPVRFIKGHQNHKPLLTPDGLKLCTKCKEAKPLSSFAQYTTSGGVTKFYSACYACKAAYARSYHHAHREAELERKNAYDKRRRENKRPPGWAATDQMRARTAVGAAVRRNALPPAWTMVCDKCQEAQAAHWHHHRGYERDSRLDVIALCVSCHSKEHRVHES